MGLFVAPDPPISWSVSEGRRERPVHPAVAACCSMASMTTLPKEGAVALHAALAMPEHPPPAAPAAPAPPPPAIPLAQLVAQLGVPPGAAAGVVAVGLAEAASAMGVGGVVAEAASAVGGVVAEELQPPPPIPEGSERPAELLEWCLPFQSL